MRLENLIADIQDAVYGKITENRTMDQAEARDTARIVGLAALKYGDLSNQASKDYVFDVERFTSFEGNTGPYILYTIVRIKSILAKYAAEGGKTDNLKLLPPVSASEKNLELALVKYLDVMEAAYMDKAPHKICQYIYEISNVFNGFYHDTKILAEQDKERKESYISLISLTKDILLSCIDLLGIECPERMYKGGINRGTTLDLCLDMKLLSFAIPCYNSADYMEKCIKSVLIGGEDVEVIIVDDGSTKDDTAEIADRYAKMYPTIVKAVHQENGGHGQAVNTGLAHATGKFFKVVDSDDWVAVSYTHLTLPTT